MGDEKEGTLDTKKYVGASCSRQLVEEFLSFFLYLMLIYYPMIHADAVLMKEIFEYRMELFLWIFLFVSFFLLERLFVETEQL